MAASAPKKNPEIEKILMSRQKQKRAISFHEKILGNAKKEIQEDNDSGSANLMHSITLLFNFLSSNDGLVAKNKLNLRKFEKLTGEALRKVPNDSVLLSIVKEHGWNGARYNFNSEMKLDEKSLLKVLGTLLLNKNQTEYTDDNSIIKSFCPDSLVAMLRATAKHAVSEPLRHQFNGTCMLVDISGFTKLSAALCTQGSTGLDSLHLAVNGYLGKCVEIVYAHGGDGKSCVILFCFSLQILILICNSDILCW